MSSTPRSFPVRGALAGAVALGMFLAACTTAATTTTTVAEEGAAPPSTEAAVSYPEITVLQPQAPWLPSFEATVAAYEEETGNQVALAVTPFDGMVQKSLNAVQAGESEFDVLMLNSQWFAQFYSEGFVSPLTEIDPEFTLDPEIIEYAYSTRWNADARAADENGEVYGLPINGNIQLFYYRTDLYAEAGLECPETWADVEANAAAIHNPPDVYGFAVRTNPPILDYLSWVYGSGGTITTYDADSDTWTIELGSDLAKETLSDWLRMGQTYGPANFAALGQPDLISLMGSGQLAQVGLVAAAAADFQDPEKSIMAGNIGACPVPGGSPGEHGAIAGIWLMAIPANLPDERKEAALAFMEWAMTAEAQTGMAKAGGIPTRRDVYEDLADDPEIGWWMKPTLDSLDSLVAPPAVIPGAQLVTVVNTRIGQVIAGELDVDTALDTAAEEIAAAFTSAGYTVAPLE